MANAILNVGSTGGQVNISTAAAPATPAAGVVTLYAGTDKALHALNSDGVDITIAAGNTGPTGPQGQAGATGPAGSNATSPITKEQTNSLVSTGVGATASATSNCAVILGNNACTAVNGGYNAIVIGPSARYTAGSGGDVVIIGSNAVSDNLNTVTIGVNSYGCAQSGVVIGSQAKTCYSLGLGSIAIGNAAVAWGNLEGGSTPIADIAIGCASTSRFGGIALGECTTACEKNGIAIGRSSRIFPGATGTVVLGSSSVGGTGACNSVVIGNSSRTTGVDTITIGDVAVTTANCGVAIGNAACSTAVSSIGIGEGAKAQSSCGIAIGFNSCVSPGFTSNIAIGESAYVFAANRAIAIGWTACANDTSVALGSISCAIGSLSTALGYNTTASAVNTVAVGYFASASASSSVAIGVGSVATHQCAVALGASITTERAATTHVQSLIAYGQAASKTNAVGSTGGSVTLNWDNSNIQTLTLTSNITTLTKSNPIDGAVYTLFITQGGTGGKTVSWGSDVEWPGGTPPTLSTAAGAVDAVSLVYIAGVTGYYGNANLNFS